MEDSLYQYFELREKPECKDMAADWFHKKWGVPKEAYLECMTDYLEGRTESQGDDEPEQTRLYIHR